MASPQINTKVSILGLEEDLANDLSRALALNFCEIEYSGTTRKTSAELVFCPAEAGILAKVRRMNPNRPVVVVSRVPEVSVWLDALEAGAADYCAAPFEAIQLRWLLDSHLTARRAAAAAA